MAQFLELHDRDNVTHLINVDYIEEIWKGDNDKATVYFAYNTPDAIQQDCFTTQETYSQIKEMLTK